MIGTDVPPAQHHSVNCKDFDGLISPAVDSCLRQDELESFLEHAGHCPPCRAEYEAERSTKEILHSRLPMVRTPPSVAGAIGAMLRREDVSARTHRPSWWRELVQNPPLRPALALAGIAVVIAVLLQGVSHRTPFPAAPADIIQQSVSNYRGVVRGSLRADVFSSEPTQVAEFFTGKIGFPVVVPSVADWSLVGGALGEFSGEPLAHLLFKRSGQDVYVYQACWDCVQRGETLSLSRHVRSSIEETGMYSEQLDDGGSVLVWRIGNACCVAVAPVSELELQRSLFPPR